MTQNDIYSQSYKKLLSVVDNFDAYETRRRAIIDIYMERELQDYISMSIYNGYFHENVYFSDEYAVENIIKIANDAIDCGEELSITEIEDDIACGYLDCDIVSYDTFINTVVLITSDDDGYKFFREFMNKILRDGNGVVQKDALRRIPEIGTLLGIYALSILSAEDIMYVRYDEIMDYFGKDGDEAITVTNNLEDLINQATEDVKQKCLTDLHISDTCYTMSNYSVILMARKYAREELLCK